MARHAKIKLLLKLHICLWILSVNKDQLYWELLLKWKRSYRTKSAWRFYFSALSPHWRAKAPRNPQNASTVLNLDVETYKARYGAACSVFTIHVLLLFVSQLPKRKALYEFAFKKQDNLVSVKFVLGLNYANQVFITFLFGLTKSYYMLFCLLSTNRN